MRKVFRLGIFSIYYDLFDFRSYAEQNEINRNFSQNRHNLKTLRLVSWLYATKKFLA